MKSFLKSALSFTAGFSLVFSSAFPAVYISAEETSESGDSNKLITDYSDLWNGSISVKAGDNVKWYVNVPEGTEPKGCGATIKIPDLGWGTDSHNKEEGHLTLKEGENFVYEFTPDKEGDILFTCWMGSGCHHNYIHVTSDGTYNAEKPSDPSDIAVSRSGQSLTVSFTAPEAPEGAKITGYKVTATDEEGKRKKLSVKESPAVFEELDAGKVYTINVITQATSGNSTGENEVRAEAESAVITDITVTDNNFSDAETAAEPAAVTAAETTLSAVGTTTGAVTETKISVTVSEQTEPAETTVTTVTQPESATASVSATTSVPKQAGTPKTGSSGAGAAESALVISGLFILGALKLRKH
ncbi:MAG: fibronectin type III domain-containing protein [Oscillospiraceae bacterium]|nr:fibronectin type III domain-containing protein [Oscillospiraceae bacterium]